MDAWNYKMPFVYIDPKNYNLSRLYDPAGRFTPLGSRLCPIPVTVPPVRYPDGRLVAPQDYDEALPDGTLVEVEGTLRLWVLRFFGSYNIYIY